MTMDKVMNKMMTPEQQAEELLKCTARCHVAAFPYSGVVSHSGDCPHLYRSAVAATLAAKDHEVALYRESANSMRNTWNTACAEIERLRSQLAEATKEVETYKRLYDLRGHALRRGCPQCGYKQKGVVAQAEREG